MITSFKVIRRPLGRVLMTLVNERWRTGMLVRRLSDGDQNLIKTGSIPPVNKNFFLHDAIFEPAKAWENELALECAMFGKRWTYKQLYQNSKNLAASLQKKIKLKKGDCQCILLPNCPEYPCIILAGSMIGLCTTTMNALYTPTEISNQLKVTESKLVYTVPKLFEPCKQILAAMKLNIPIVVLKNDPKAPVPEGSVDFWELVTLSTPLAFDKVNVDSSDTAVIPFSSGTSGLPKGVELTHRNLTSNLSQIKVQGGYLIDRSDRDQTISLAVLPMFHIYGMTVVTLSTLLMGGLVLSLPEFEPKSFVESIYKKKCHVLFLVPPLVFFLAHHAAVLSEHLKYVRYALIGAAPCGIAPMQTLKNKAPNLTIVQGYGMTETSPAVTITHKDRPHKFGSAGYPVPETIVKVADLKTGKALPRGSEGEICVKGPQIMKGYFKNPEITKAAFDQDGFLKTGDIGYFDKDNDLFVADRIKELIKVKGFQVAPAELEEILRSHPKIADAGVVGVPHPTLGEVPRAFIVLKKENSMTEADVMEFLKEKLTSYKLPAGGIIFIKAIPRSSAGKILRRELMKAKVD